MNVKPTLITRRRALLAGAGAFALGSRSVDAQMGGGGMGSGGMGGGMGGGMISSPATTAFQVPLPTPPALSPNASGFYELTVKAAQKQIIPGLSTQIWGYNGSFPGPTIKAKRGVPLMLRVKNALNENIVTHLHGGHVPVDVDGHAMDFIAPGSYRDYLYPNNQEAATIWYHDHTMDRTGYHVWMGMAGFYVIEDDAEASLPLPSGAQDIAFVIQDRLFNSDGSLNYTLSQHDIMQGKLGDVILVNGAVQPYLQVATRKYRFRILNGSNSRQYQLALSTGQPFTQIGSDGGLLQAPVTRSTILIAPGERVEVVVDFAGYKLGTKIVLKNQLGSGRTADIMRFDVARRESETASVPSTLRPIFRVPPTLAAATRQFTLGMNMMGSGFTINGLSYDHMRVDATPALNTTEIGEFINPMGMAHPMHSHATMWQILDRDGSPPPAWEAGWKDTWLVPPQGRVRVIGSFADYACDPDPMMYLQNYMLHCHILEHEDHGMMAQFKVVAG